MPCGVALAATAPSAGTVLQQSLPQPAPLQAPGSVLELPTPKLQKSQSSLRIPVRSISIRGNHLMSDSALQPLVDGAVGKTVTLGQLQAAVHRITEAYHRHGYPLSYAYLPAQSVRHGHIDVRVIEARYDRVTIHNTSRLSDGEARRTLGIAAGEAVASGPLNRGLLLLNRTPGVRVGATFVPGAQPATSTLKLALHRGRLFDASVGEDNYGSASTGRYRTLANLSLNNPLGYGSQLAVNGLTTSGGLLHSGGFALTSPGIWQGLRAGVYGSRTIYRLGGAFASLGERGYANQIGVDLSYPLILEPGRLLSARLDLLRNGLGTSASGYDRRSHLYLQRLTVSGVYANGLGGISSASVQVTHGHLTGDSADARSAHTQIGSGGGFWMGQLTLSQSQPLVAGLVGRLSLTGQAASRNLDSSQKLYLGGPYGVMSYAVGEAGGDEGVLARARLSHRVPLPRVAGRLSAALLLQGGTVWVNHSIYTGYNASNRINVGGAGIGLRYQWRRHVSARFAYVRTLGSGLSNPQGGELWASLKLSL